MFNINLLLTGIWEDIQRRKHLAQNSWSNHEVIRDIIDGKIYKDLSVPGGFLSNPNNLSAVMNTDGVNLYSSSKVELWPIFLCINEISPAARFSRDNMLLVGIWQGKGKPPFRQYLSVFSEEMNGLYNFGIDVHIAGVEMNVKLAVICATLDLPAKAAVMNMSLFNGQHACITCEEPGQVVRQGKGHARCYPYRLADEKHPIRTSEGIQVHMTNASDRHRIMGFRGLSGLVALKSIDLVSGIVPDYMHGLLLGITKMLLDKWFSPTQNGNPYFVGKELTAISRRLQKINPPDFIERLPRDLETHYKHFKATELQTWLLYYGLPCLTDILPDKYLENFARLSEATYVLLGDSISTEALKRAEHLLDAFYSEFEGLYGGGSCGLNVHNAGAHLTFYVSQLGPLWAWSCFAFEDSNAMILQSVHGTGVVVKQILRFRQAQAVIRQRKTALSDTNVKRWTKTKEMLNCSVAGSIKQMKLDDIAGTVMNALGVTDISELCQVDRILLNGQKFFSSNYMRMKRRVCNAVLLEDDRLGHITRFVLLTKMVYAVVAILKQNTTRGQRLSAGKHIIPVSSTNVTELVLVNELVETVIFIKCVDEDSAHVSRMPNRHGHSVFK